MLKMNLQQLGGRGSSGSGGGKGGISNQVRTISVNSMRQATNAFNQQGYIWEDIDSVKRYVMTTDNKTGERVFFSFSGTAKEGFIFTKLDSRPKGRLKKGW